MLSWRTLTAYAPLRAEGSESVPAVVCAFGATSLFAIYALHATSLFAIYSFRATSLCPIVHLAFSPDNCYTNLINALAPNQLLRRPLP